MNESSADVSSARPGVKGSGMRLDTLLSSRGSVSVEKRRSASTYLRPTCHLTELFSQVAHDLAVMLVADSDYAGTDQEADVTAVTKALVAHATVNNGVVTRTPPTRHCGSTSES